MKVSIVTISFNQARFLERAIQSVVEQDYTDIEYIVVDPGSTDGSREIIERYRERIDRMILEPDDGPADGLNKGFSLATGDIFGFLNADDFLLPGAIRQVVQAFRKSDKDVVSGHAYIVDEDGATLRRFYTRRFSPRAYVYGAAMIAQPSTFFKSSSFRRIKGFNTQNRIAWDSECWVDMALSGARFSRLNSFLSCFRVYPQSISGSGQMNGEQALQYRNRIFSRVLGRPKGPSDRLLRILMKVAEYATHPRVSIERLFKGRTISVGSLDPALSVSGRNNHSAAKYLTYVIFGMPIFAVQAQPRYMRRAALRRYQPSTWKRAIYKGVLDLSMIAGADRLFCRSVQTPLQGVGAQDFDLELWLEEMRKYFGEAELAAVIVWPKQLERERIYVHLLHRAEPIGFAKISLRGGPDPRLSREAATLRDIYATNLKSFRVPRLLLEEKLNGYPYLLLEPLPNSARPIASKMDLYPEECVGEYSGPTRHIEASRVPVLSWWERYRERLDDQCTEFDEELNGIMDGGLDICRAHGDLSAHNIFYDGRMLWICDWEESATDAPIQTDRLGFDMAASASIFERGSILTTKRFKKKYLMGEDSRVDIMMALAFRHTARINDATTIIHNWSKVK